jgi:hypothetical protein
MRRTETMTGQAIVIDTAATFIDAADSRPLRHRDQTIGFD